ncbi:hypothetical protein KBB96_05175 [Luteolibacter ambystomatis]|uniref:Uncharacterized protein n=1 Tax=Luteolibacter ambystomatis TaxID=2824561 RepID=A0A975PFW9_9BACT|nr:hypothetical protein [Luteolibacter ambystomatis]QUE52284.1 hypothetical protein KBB96_05175 [Luteolibacter ambystomatis]
MKPSVASTLIFSILAIGVVGGLIWNLRKGGNKPNGNEVLSPRSDAASSVVRSVDTLASSSVNSSKTDGSSSSTSQALQTPVGNPGVGGRSSGAVFEGKNGGMTLGISQAGTFRVSIPAQSSSFFKRTADSPLSPIEGFGVPTGAYIKIRNKAGEILTNNPMIDGGWYTPLIHSSKITVIDPRQKPDLIAVSADSGEIPVSRLLEFLERTQPDLPPLSELEFKILVKSEALRLYKADGSSVTAADLKDIESGWLNGRYLEKKP